jgi:hypothetical protein
MLHIVENNKINVTCQGYDWLWSWFVLRSYTGTCLDRPKETAEHHHQDSPSLALEFTCTYICQILSRSTNHLADIPYISDHIYSVPFQWWTYSVYDSKAEGVPVPCHEDIGSGSIALPLLTLALGGGEWSASCLSHFTPWERAGCTRWIGDWMRSSAGLDAVE